MNAMTAAKCTITLFVHIIPTNDPNDGNALGCPLLRVTDGNNYGICRNAISDLFFVTAIPPSHMRKTRGLQKAETNESVYLLYHGNMRFPLCLYFLVYIFHYT